jgi:hypothetical protein
MKNIFLAAMVAMLTFSSVTVMAQDKEKCKKECCKKCCKHEKCDNKKSDTTSRKTS